MLSSRSEFRLNDQNAFPASMGQSCRLVARLAGHVSAGWAQLAPSPDAPPVSTAPAQPAEDESVATLKLNVNLVDVFFTVKDKDGNLVPHLTKSDCTVTEDNAPQTLKSFVAETQQPLTLGILLDTSGSQDARAAAGAGCGQPVSGSACSGQRTRHFCSPSM